MPKKDLPKAGDKIPVGEIHVSERNVRAGAPFGESEEDQLLIDQLTGGRIIEPFKARPEGDGYGVYVGRRRFLAKKKIGTEEFVVGRDCLIEDVSDEEAREASLVENIELLRKKMDPMTRAEALNDLISHSPTGLRGTAGRLGIGASTLSEWLKVLDLRPPMREALRKGHIYYSDGLEVAKLELGKEKELELAEVAEGRGRDAFKKELDRIPTGQRRRGLKPGLWTILRIMIDKRNKTQMEEYRKLENLAKENNMKVEEYAWKEIIRPHITAA